MLLSEGKAIISSSYMDLEDLHLGKALEKVPVDAVTDDIKMPKKYWQRIIDKFHHEMPTPSTRSLGSLQGRYDVIKQCCRH
jgi:hypothetical protein